jgi:uncharacterized membrane protein
MKPLIVLLTVFLLSVVILWLSKPAVDFTLAGRISMAAMLVLTAFGHFKFAEGMELMLPEWMPFKRQWVHVTGILELLAAVGLLVPAAYPLTGVLLIIFFLLILPANVISSLKGVNIEKATFDGPGMSYLWFRIPLQVLFIGWVYLVTLSKWAS